MANTLAITETISSDTTTITITDTTTYSSPARSAVGVFLGVYKVDARGGLTSVTVTPNDEDPGAVTSWTIPYNADGHYKIYQISIPDYAVGSYDQGDVVYDNVNGIVYESRSDNNTDTLDVTASWREILTPDTLAPEAPANCDVQVKDKLWYENVKNARYSAAVEESILTVNPDKPTKFHYLDLFYEGLKAAEATTEYLSGEKIARRAEGII
jgi:hypothetical protein